MTRATEHKAEEKAAPETAATAQAAAPMIVSPDAYKAEQARQAQAEGLAKGLDQTVPGGRYKVGNRVVDANGDEIKD